MKRGPLINQFLLIARQDSRVGGSCQIEIGGTGVSLLFALSTRARQSWQQVDTGIHALQRL